MRLFLFHEAPVGKISIRPKKVVLVKKRKSYENNEKPKGKQEEKIMRKSVKVMAAAMAAMMALAGCGSKTAETTAADTTAAETTAEAASEETTTEAAGVELADCE